MAHRLYQPSKNKRPKQLSSTMMGLPEDDPSLLNVAVLAAYVAVLDLKISTRRDASLFYAQLTSNF
jgi:hypothetical protein